jgi:putative endonuclease
VDDPNGADMDKPRRGRAVDATRRELGDGGEEIVAAHLRRLGWRILEAKFRCRRGEIDLIAEEPDGAALVFVEVKARRSRTHGAPAEAVDGRKQTRMIEAARAYLARRDAGAEEPLCRFDVAEVLYGPDGLASVRMVRGAFGT